MIVSQTVTTTGASLFGVDPASLHSLGGNDGAVYSCRRGNRAYVIKFNPVKAGESESQADLARFEERLEFVRYLSENEVPVAAPVPSNSDRLYERVRGDEGDFLVVLTPRADGRNPTARNAYDWTDRLFHAWGRVTGRMHALALRYPKWEKTSSTALLDWNDEYTFFARWCKEARVVERWEAVHGALQALPRDRSCYGLIHNDLHQWNIFYNPDSTHPLPLTVLDFDVSAYHWYLTDIAIALYHAMNDGSSKSLGQREAFARSFMEPYLKGYCMENELDANWLQHLPTFLTYREILIYIVFSNEWPKETRVKWQNEFLSSKRRRILAGEPVITALY